MYQVGGHFPATSTENAASTALSVFKQVNRGHGRVVEADPSENHGWDCGGITESQIHVKLNWLGLVPVLDWIYTLVLA